LKKLAYIFFLLYFLNSFSGKAQQYVPLVVDSTHWIIEHCDYDAMPPTGSAWEYYILGDTIVNLIPYKKVYKRGWDYPFCDISYQTIYPYSLFSLIREDTLTKKVYSTGGGWACPSGNDTLMYDFDLQIGDTTNTCITRWKVLDTIIQGNIWLSSKLYTIGGGYELYEGVGSQFGLFERMTFSVSGGGDPRLTHYCRGDLSNCGLTLSSEENSNFTDNLLLYPNPATNQLIIEYDLNIADNLLIEIYSIDGKRRFSKTMNMDKINLDVSKFSQGIYFIRLINDKKIIAMQKWLKTN
jgi:type IX secretion system substrate protein